MKSCILLLLIICMGTIQCKKSAQTEAVLTGKLVVNGPCGYYAIQLLNGNIDTANIVASWYDTDNDSTYTNIFSVTNFCNFGTNNLSKDDIFTFQLDPNPPAQTCLRCLIAAAIPPKENAVKNVKKKE